MNRNKFNVTKFMILSTISYLNEQNVPANSKTISKLSSIKHSAVMTFLSEQGGLFNIRYDKKKTDGCLLLYTLNERGKRRLNQLLDRFANGYNLKLRNKPEPYDWSGFVLLPGLEVNRDDQSV